MFSLASIATMSACIFLFGVFYSIGVNFTAMVRAVEEGVAVTVFFQPDVPQENIDAIGQEIADRPEVANYRFVTAEEAWEEFRDVYFEGHEDAAAVFSDDNPLANSAHYEIYLNDVSKQEELVNYLQGLDGVREVHQSEVAADVLTDFNRLIGYIFTGVILILVAVAIFLISNTVTTGISVRREEIAIMKLIGAKDSFVRAPFVVEGMFIGWWVPQSRSVASLFHVPVHRLLRGEPVQFPQRFSGVYPDFPGVRILVPVSLLLAWASVMWEAV